MVVTLRILNVTRNSGLMRKEIQKIYFLLLIFPLNMAHNERQPQLIYSFDMCGEE